MKSRFAALVAALFLASAAVAAPADDGLAAIARGDYRFAADLLQGPADRGDLRAQVALGKLYAKGEGVRQNPGLAEVWLSKAADQGDVSAQVALGDLYAEGLGGARDREQALAWYAKAADRGDPAGRWASRSSTTQG